MKHRAAVLRALGPGDGDGEGRDLAYGLELLARDLGRVLRDASRGIFSVLAHRLSELAAAGSRPAAVPAVPTLPPGEAQPVAS